MTLTDYPPPNSERSDTADVTPVLLAVIDIGTTSIRMSIAQRDETGDIHELDTLKRPADLGKDAFTKGSLQRETIEECVNVLLDYRRVLDEYGFSPEDKLRVVATNAVREAQNRLAFLDRIFVATGFSVDLIEDAEVNRLAYLGVQPYIARNHHLNDATTLVIEIGGGSTDILSLTEGIVSQSHSYRLGSLRLGETLQLFRMAQDKRLPLLNDHIRRIVERIHVDFPSATRTELIALGSEARFAASHLIPDWKHDCSTTIPIQELENFTEDIIASAPDDLVRNFNITFIEAETLGITLSVYLHIARCYDLKHIHVSDSTLRDGLLTELALDGAWTDDFRNLVIRSAIDLGSRYHFNETHALHTAHLCNLLFTELRHVHRLPMKYELILSIAALLHDVGYIVSDRSHHKHSMYLIMNSTLFGMSKMDLLLIALVARYHRRANPKPLHDGYATLDSQSRIAVSQMAAILRTADALDRSARQRISNFSCSQDGHYFIITVPEVKELSLEQLALNEKGTLFENVFGMSILLRSG